MNLDYFYPAMAAWLFICSFIFLFISCLRSVREMRFIANRTADVRGCEFTA